ncbi:MAG: TIGR01777 family oxidoreductase [Acidimicrobiia bacterium]|nr:TIGR01777 family oxidoreductase [Acidimicrobiia bacterium]
MRIVISGATGFIGSALLSALETAGHDVVALSRSGRPGTVHWDPVARTTEIDGHVDAIIHLAGETIGGRWSVRKKHELIDSRVAGTTTMAQVAVEKQVSHFLSGSAIGYYGSRADTVLPETAAPGDGFLADLTGMWESAAQPAIDAGIPTAFGRTALVLDGVGGSFPRMLLPYKFGVGGPIGSGKQWWSWITLRDEVRAIMHVVDRGITGPVNLSAPEPIRNADFAKALGRAMHRPAVIPAPGFGLKLLLGSEFADQVLLASQRVLPRVLAETGFEYLDPDLPDALSRILDS